VFLATNAPERKPSTIALIEKLTKEKLVKKDAPAASPVASAQ